METTPRIACHVVDIADGRLDPQAAIDFVADDAFGGIDVFIGRVRANSHGRECVAVHYDMFDPLALLRAAGFGLFVTLDAMYVEGLIHITELGGEYFRFDEARQELRGERTGIRYALGTKVQVQVSRVDLDGRRIDFRLVTGEDELLLRAMRDKTGAAGLVGERDESKARDGGGRRKRQDDDRGSKDRSSKGRGAPPAEPKASAQRGGGKSAGRGGARTPAGKSRKSRR